MSTLNQGQVVVITGAAAGIGLALAEAFAQRGLQLSLGDSDPDALARVVQGFTDRGIAAMGLTVDVSDREAVRRFKDATLKRFGRVDIVCNNAGVYNKVAAVWEIDPDEWRRLVEVNYWGVVHGIQEFLPLLLAQGAGHVVTTASVSGLSTVPGMADYSPVKHAVIALMETLRVDLDMAGARRIGTTVLCPAIVDTAMWRRALGLITDSDPNDDRKMIGSGPDLASILAPEYVAQVTIKAIEENRFYVLPTPGSQDRLLKRIQPILDAFNAQ